MDEENKSKDIELSEKFVIFTKFNSIPTKYDLFKKSIILYT